jgi:hypothetical protein
MSAWRLRKNDPQESPDVTAAQFRHSPLAMSVRRGTLPDLLRFRVGRAAGFLARLAAFILLGAVCTSGLRAQPGRATVDEVKAAYIHKFAGYVDWPPGVFADAAAPCIVGVVGSDVVYAELLHVVAGRPVQGRTVQVRLLTRPEQAAGVHMLFIGHDAWPVARSWIAAVKGRPVVVVTDAPNGSAMGAALTFVQVNKRLRFEASVRAAEQAGLRLSSRLLAVAQRVVDSPP